MYDHIVGEVIEKQAARAVLLAGGVGYELKVPMSTSSQLELGSTTRLFTILHVIDGTPTLLGFATKTERELARQLLAVSGVGPAMCLAILSAHAPVDVATAIVAGDVTTLQRVKGIGKKTAERLCLELRDHVQRLDLADLADLAARGSDHSVGAPLPPRCEDAIAALVTLGYAEKDARTKISKLAQTGSDAPTEALIRRVLSS